jgi:NitT/TauT family transport system ATP-binding protein
MTLLAREVTRIYRSRERETVALDSVSLDVADGEFVSLVGPSGCGKSTFLHMLGGHDRPTRGEIWLGPHRVRGPGAELGMVFQKHTLFPWLSVWKNVRFPHTLARARTVKPDAAELRARRDRAEQLLRLVGLWDFRDCFPNELSGGMQQRATIARALVAQPQVLLMDEPFGALDAQTREGMQDLLLTLTRHHRTTTIFVTHDVEEAMLLSDRVVVLSARPGRIVDEVPIEIPRHDRTPDLKLDAGFIRRKREIHDLLHVSEGVGEGRVALLRDLTHSTKEIT